MQWYSDNRLFENIEVLQHQGYFAEKAGSVELLFIITNKALKDHYDSDCIPSSFLNFYQLYRKNAKY